MLETCSEGDAKVVKKDGLVRVTIRNEVNSFPQLRNGVFQIVELAEALKASEEGAGEVLKTAGLVRVTVRSGVDSLPLPANSRIHFRFARLT